MKRTYKILSMILALAMLLVLSGCDEREPQATVPTVGVTTAPTLENAEGGETTPDVTQNTEPEQTVPATDPEATEPAETVPEETVPATEPEVTEPAVTVPEEPVDPTEPPVPTEPVTPTEPKPTEPVPTEPKPTEPVPTEPKPTEPPHQHSYTKQVVDPTCTAKGYSKYSCSCGNSYKDDYVDALGHNWSDWEVTQQPTFKEEGKKQRTCSTCGSIDTQKIDKLEAADCSHSYEDKVVAGTCESEGYTEHTCTACGYSYKDSFTSMLAHDMQETDRKAATTSQEGYITYTCSGCGKTETTVLEKEVLDLRVLEEYGRQYAVDKDGYEICIGLRAGYYPGVLEKITSMEQGYKEVREAIEATTQQLVDRGEEIVKEMEDGTLGRFRLDVEIVHEYGDYYRIWVYYG